MTTEITNRLTISELIDALDTSPTINIGAERTFSTGSKGFTVNCRLVINGKQYVGTMNLVELGSKPKDGNATPRGASEQHAADSQNGPVTSTRRNRNRD
jgi:hypothetical protein